MAIAYFDCPTGIAGDMCLGALLDAGLPLSYLEEQLAQLDIRGEFSLEVETVQRQGQQATKLWVRLRENRPKLTHDHHHSGQVNGDAHGHPHTHSPSRHLPEILTLIEQSELPPRVKAWSTEVFQKLAQAEAQVHGIPAEQVHFHEVGAVDAIVDIVGTCIALDWFDIERLYCSALPTGGGTVSAAHGRLPVPVPAVLQLWQQRQVPVYSNGIQRELVTPTGAALMVALATEFGGPPAMSLERVGLGAGSAALPIPNALRVWIGEDSSVSPPAASAPTPLALVASPALGALEAIAVLETQVDDLSPQVIGYLFERLLGAGALDVFTQAIGMKKSRPGVLISVVCPIEQVNICEQVLFQETSTLGIRRRTQQRTILQRSSDTVETPYGPVRIKVARSRADGPVVNVQPEYEDCAQLARAASVPLRKLQEQALQCWQASYPADKPQ